MSKSRIVIVRHAESESNIRHNGTPFIDKENQEFLNMVSNEDISITTKGEEQAKKTGEALKKKFGVFDHIYHSGYLRTIKTMQKILEAYSPEEQQMMMIHEDIRIRERDSGYTRNMTKEEIDILLPYVQQHFKTEGPFLARPIGGESVADLVTGRARSFVDMINNYHQGENILIVSHGRTIFCKSYIIEGWTLQFVKKLIATTNMETVKNCGVIVYEKPDNEKWKIVGDYGKIYY